MNGESKLNEWFDSSIYQRLVLFCVGLYLVMIHACSLVYFAVMIAFFSSLVLKDLMLVPYLGATLWYIYVLHAYLHLSKLMLLDEAMHESHTGCLAGCSWLIVCRKNQVCENFSVSCPRQKPRLCFAWHLCFAHQASKHLLSGGNLLDTHQMKAINQQALKQLGSSMWVYTTAYIIFI
jgi:hypothetical protein